MDHSSPTRYDVDFYMKKCDRLEEDIMLMGDELNRARIRLRKAEDFEIKYELLSKQKLAADEELVRKDAELVMLCAKNQ